MSLGRAKPKSTSTFYFPKDIPCIFFYRSFCWWANQQTKVNLNVLSPKNVFAFHFLNSSFFSTFQRCSTTQHSLRPSGSFPILASPGNRITDIICLDIWKETSCHLSHTGKLNSIAGPVYRSITEPYFSYCSLVWDSTGKTQSKQLQRLQNRAARIVTGLPYTVRSSQILELLGWSSLTKMRMQQKAVMMYRVILFMALLHPIWQVCLLNKWAPESMTFEIPNLIWRFLQPKPQCSGTVLHSQLHGFGMHFQNMWKSYHPLVHLKRKWRLSTLQQQHHCKYFFIILEII